MGSVCAIVVTYNRVDLLRECLDAIFGQTRPPDRVLVVDNASTDDTRDILATEYPQADVLTLAQNEGSAGGFHEGMKRAHAEGAEWLWLMDDDTIPRPDALAELLAGAERADPAPILLVSRALWKDGHMHPMNTPWPARNRSALMIQGAEKGLMPLGSATWVSLLVHRRAVDRYGLPAKHFFIWSDDIEYTGRILTNREESGYLVPTSVVVHKTSAPHTAMTSPPDRFYFHVRNTLYIILRSTRSRRDRLVFFWILVYSTAEYLGKNPAIATVPAILRGIRDGVRRPAA